MGTTWRRLLALLMVVVVMAAGCGDDDDEPAISGEGETSTTEATDDTEDEADGEQAEPAEVNVSASEYAFEVPESVEAGATRLTLENTGSEAHHAQLFRLNDDATMEDVQAQLAEGNPAALLEVGLFTGGTGTVNPGGESSAESVPVLEEGTYALMCFIDAPDGAPHVAKGMLQPFEVTAAEDAPTEVATEGEVGLVDFGFTVPDEVSGDAALQVVNNGQQPHEANIVKLAEGATQDDVAAFFSGEAQGPPMFESVGGMQALLPGPEGTQVLQLDVEPGQYVFICLIPDVADGTPHFQKGMIRTVEIT